MDKKFIVTPKEEKGIIMTIRIDRKLQEKYDKLSCESNRSRNELINMAFQFPLDNLEFIESAKIND